MLLRIKQKIIEKINKNGNSIFEPTKNKETINALKEIFNDTKTAAEGWFKYVEEINKA